eukprot:TRINITY_DN14977_c0_g1_i1.p1 TRINITY_DN14977_c0_g1~~TRINITY_DN14977_c0_g1_i1.p1  ORF type:complete len:130 (+),score=18.44 TRINITY_DN14977_c0_g1_i1:555-944(+)
MYRCVRDRVINDDIAEVFFPDTANTSTAFLRVVDRALTRDWSQTLSARRNYLLRYHGQIDGFEEYRLALELLEASISVGTSVASTSTSSSLRSLKSLLANFSSIIVGEGHPQPPPCDTLCCKKVLHDSN